MAINKAGAGSSNLNDTLNELREKMDLVVKQNCAIEHKLSHVGNLAKKLDDFYELLTPLIPALTDALPALTALAEKKRKRRKRTVQTLQLDVINFLLYKIH